jgi:large subunit ribosomal protein L29
MARYKEFRDMSVDELRAQLLERKKSLFNLRLRHATKELENTAQMSQERKAIAVINTLIGEKSRAAGSGQSA